MNELYELDVLAAERPQQTALRWGAGVDVSTWTWRMFAARAAGVAQALSARELPPGAPVAVIGGNQPNWILLREALRWLGMTFVPIGPKLAPAERDYLIRNSESVLALGPSDLPTGTCLVEAWDWVTDVRADAFPERPAQAAPQQLLYTSGSSGKPKGVLRARGSDDTRIRQSIRAYGLTPQMHNLVAGPLYHSGPAIFFRIFRRMGATQTVLPRFSAHDVARLVADGAVDTLFMVPTMWRMLLEALAELDAAPQLKVAWIAGSKTEPDLRAALLDTLGEGVLWEFYGSTETGTVSVLPPDKQRTHGHTVGFPLDEMEIRIVDAQGGVLPAGQSGRVYVKSPTTMAGYHRGPGADPDLREDMLDGGWVSVGDTGYITADGALVLAGREKGMIITGGINVYPEEVEAALTQLDGVREAVVFGLSDPKWGSRICALVEPNQGMSLDADGILEALREQIAGFKIPKQMRICEIPRTPSQKVVRDVQVLEAVLNDVDAGAPSA